MKLIIIFLALFAIKTCENGNKKSHFQEDQIENINGSYFIKKITAHEFNNRQLTIDFNKENNLVSGFSGCNRFTGSYNLEKGVLKISPLATTRKLCHEEANTTEYKLLEYLSKVNSFSIKDTTLNLLADNIVLVEAVLRNTQKDDMTFIYSATSRGVYQKITINKKEIFIEKKRGEVVRPKSYNDTIWNTLLKIARSIDIKNLSTLEPPTKDHQFDGAALARLTIINNRTLYETKSFDHGNPPKEITTIVKEILSIAQNIE